MMMDKHKDFARIPTLDKTGTLTTFYNKKAAWLKKRKLTDVTDATKDAVKELAAAVEKAVKAAEA